jgi:hypothetical protein
LFVTQIPPQKFAPQFKKNGLVHIQNSDMVIHLLFKVMNEFEIFKEKFEKCQRDPGLTDTTVLIDQLNPVKLPPPFSRNNSSSNVFPSGCQG